MTPRDTLTGVLLRATALGLASGGRSSSGLSALALRGPLPVPLPLTPRAVPWAVGGELLTDKLPVAPSRLSPPVLASRVAAGALCGLVVARRAGAPPGVPVVAAGLAAAVASALGVRWRAAHPGVRPALVEDAVSLALAAAAAR